MKKILVSWNDIESQTQEILRQLHLDGWRPDYVVGITRGGAVPAVLISQYLNVPMHPLEVSLRDGGERVSNFGMSEDAFGSNHDDAMTSDNGRKQILIVDDINDSGATLNWIKQDWQSGCFPNDTRWMKEIWGHNVRVAVLYDNESSQSELDIAYAAVTINKAEEDSWIEFPWENWWAK